MNRPMRVAVCGAGTMGAGIAQLAAAAGTEVVVMDVDAATLAAGQARTERELARQESRGRLDGSAASVLARLTWVDRVEDIGRRDLVIEAIIERIDIKRGLFAALEGVVGADAVIASNTSSLPIVQLARDLARPQRFLGMHFFNPATVMKLVEIVPGSATDPDVVAFTEEAARRWGKIAVHVADVPRFIVNRISRPFHAEGFRALQEGIPPALIDHLFRAGGGFRIGPLELADLIGQDINFGTTCSIHAAYFGATRFVPHRVQAGLVEGGLLGRKSGRGIYDYRDGEPGFHAPAPDRPAAAARAIGEVALGDTLPAEGAAILRVTRGLTAAEETRAAGRDVAVVDWCAPGGTGMGFACADGVTEAAADGIASLGFDAHRLPDRPGLLVARGIAQIANAAMDAVLERVSDADGIDAAMRFGASCPFGPIEWARRLGLAEVAGLLGGVARGTGLPIYTPGEQWFRP